MSLTAFLFGDFGDRVDAPAFVDGSQRAVDHVRRARGDGRQARGGAGRARHRGGRRRRALRAQLAGVGRRLPRRPARQRHRHQRELALHAGRAGPPARRLGRQAARHGVAVPRPGRRGARRGRACPTTRWSRSTPSTASPRSPTCSRPRRRRRSAPRPRPTPRCCRTRRGRPAGPRASSSRTATSSRTSCQIARDGADVGSDTKILAVLPFFHIYGMTVHDEPGPAQARHGGHHAEVRPHGVPADHLRVPGPAGLHRAAGGRRARQAPEGRRVRPVLHRGDLLRRRAAGRRARPRHGQAAGVHGAAGLRDDRAVAGEPLHARRPSRLDLNSSGFAVPNVVCKLVDPESRRGGRPRRPRRAVGEGAERDERAT